MCFQQEREDDGEDEPTISSRLAEILIDALQLEYGNGLLSRIEAMTITFDVMSKTFHHVRPGDEDDVDAIMEAIKYALQRPV